MTSTWSGGHDALFAKDFRAADWVPHDDAASAMHAVQAVARNPRIVVTVPEAFCALMAIEVEVWPAWLRRFAAHLRERAVVLCNTVEHPLLGLTRVSRRAEATAVTVPRGAESSNEPLACVTKVV